MGEEGGDQDLQVQWEAPGSDARQERILVSVRLRPLNSKEIQSNDFADWEAIDSTTILFKNCLSERSMYPNAYTFDKVFGFDSSTKQVYEEAAKEVALSVLNGINSSVFAYGQTSSGKTFTMGGITQFAVSDIYDYIQRHKEREFVLKFSAMEIYNEHVRDLLSADTTPLRLLDDPERGTVVERIIEETVTDKSHLLELIAVCEAQRQIGETSLNETSSRSHQILRLTIESSARQFGGGNASMLAANVNFVDLAGSERTSQTQSTGARLKEGSHINRSLLTLGKVIRTLSKGRNGHVPYRDSKLTRILHNSLGGNARTAIICTMSPAHSHLEQSRNTLLFASCAKEVTTNAQVNVVMSDKALVKHLRKELARLESELKSMSLVSSKGDVASVLKEKEHQIEKMDREIKELSHQRDLAQSKVEELLQSAEKNQVSLPEDDGSHHTSSISREKISWPDDSSITSDSSDYQRLDVDLATSESFQYLDDHSSNFELSTQPSDLLKNFDHTFVESSSQLVRHSIPDVAPPSSDDPSNNWEEMTTTGTIEEEEESTEENCKEVRCIEVEEQTINRKTEIPQHFKLSPQEQGHEEEIETEDENEKEKENLCFLKEHQIEKPNEEEETETEKGIEKEEEKFCSLKEIRIEKPEEDEQTETERENEKERESKHTKPSEKTEERDPHQHKCDAEHEVLVKKIKELQRTIDCLVNRNLLEHPSPRSTGPERPSFRWLSRSRSCKPVLTTTTPASPAFEKVVVHYRDQSFGGFASERPKGLPTGQNEGAEREKVSKLGFATSIRDAIMREMEQDSKHSDASEASSIYSSVAWTNEDAITESDKQMGDEMDGNRIQEKGSMQDGTTEEEEPEPEPAAEAEAKAESKNRKSDNDSMGEDASFMMQVRDCMSEGTPSTVQSPLNWHEEFESQRFKIIELWQACHIPLVHRTYFFLLFKGDPSDKLYMEVELRRLSFIKNRFSQGQKIVMDGQVFTPSSSTRALNQEREMLMRQMYKRIPVQERESVFQKWGIAMNSKQRRLQLAGRLWTDTKDMQHIKESANVVAKLVGFTDEGQVPKEMFVGPSFTPKTLNRRSYSWKSSMSSIA